MKNSMNHKTKSARRAEQIAINALNEIRYHNEVHSEATALHQNKKVMLTTGKLIAAELLAGKDRKIIRLMREMDALDKRAGKVLLEVADKLSGPP